MTKRRNFSDQLPADVALEALRVHKTVQEIAANGQVDVVKRDEVWQCKVNVADHLGHLGSDTFCLQIAS